MSGSKPGQSAGTACADASTPVDNLCGEMSGRPLSPTVHNIGEISSLEFQCGESAPATEDHQARGHHDEADHEVEIAPRKDGHQVDEDQ
jgi:hypothetical protein